MEKYIEHLRDQLDLDIKELEDKKSVLQDLKNKLSSYGYNRSSKFKCLLGKSDRDAICPECDNVLPYINVRDKDIEVQPRSYPLGMGDELKTRCKNNEEGCIQWRKKKHTTVCGCGGTATCKCGYSLDFCNLVDNSCSYCGRELNVVYSPRHKQLTFTMEKEKENEK